MTRSDSLLLDIVFLISIAKGYGVIPFGYGCVEEERRRDFKA